MPPHPTSQLEPGGQTGGGLEGGPKAQTEGRAAGASLGAIPAVGTSAQQRRALRNPEVRRPKTARLDSPPSPRLNNSQLSGGNWRFARLGDLPNPLEDRRKNLRIGAAFPARGRQPSERASDLPQPSRVPPIGWARPGRTERGGDRRAALPRKECSRRGWSSWRAELGWAGLG